MYFGVCVRLSQGKIDHPIAQPDAAVAHPLQSITPRERVSHPPGTEQDASRTGHCQPRQSRHTSTGVSSLHTVRTLSLRANWITAAAPLSSALSSTEAIVSRGAGFFCSQCAASNAATAHWSGPPTRMSWHTSLGPRTRSYICTMLQSPNAATSAIRGAVLMTSAGVSGMFQVRLQLVLIQIDHGDAVTMQGEHERDAVHAGQSRCHADGWEDLSFKF